MLPDYALLHAIKDGVSADFDEAIACGANSCARDLNGMSAIEIAGENGRAEFIRKLVELGADQNQPIGKRGDVLLHRAARTGNIGFVATLLDLGAYPSPVNSAGKTPLHLAAMNGFQFLADSLIAHGASASETTPQGDQPLHIAARRGDVPMIRSLLKAGASIEATNNTGYTPLHEAAAAGKTEAIEYLIKESELGSHRRMVLLPRVRRAAELHGHDDTAAVILAAEGGTKMNASFPTR